MAFESLTDKLQNVFKNLRSKGRLTEADVKEAMKEVKRALLEADVNFRVVKSFVKTVISFPCLITSSVISEPIRDSISSFTIFITI